MKLKPGTIWITGLSASGKTTLGMNLTERLKMEGVNNIRFLDGEELRKNLDRVYGHTIEERYKVLSNVIRIVNECNNSGNIAIVSTISHQIKAREIARREIKYFMEVYLNCPAEICAKRDFKGNYNRAIKKENECFAGITEPYEESANPELILNTFNTSIDECSDILFEHVQIFLKEDKKSFYAQSKC